MRTLGLFLGILFFAYWARAADNSRRTDLADITDSMMSESSLKGSSWSILFYSLSGDSIIFELDADRLLTPASITKLFTSAAALDALGPDFQFSTVVNADGEISKDGILDGDLVVQAGGDPTAEIKASKYFHAPVLRAVADSLVSSGLRHIAGNLVLRTWPYRLESASPEWEIGDITAGFAPAVDGFGFNNNVCHLGIHPGPAIGAPASFELDPVFAPVQLNSEVQTVSSEIPAWIESWFAPHDSTITLIGEIPLGDDGEYLWLPVEDPARYFGAALLDALNRRDVKIDGAIVVDRSWNARTYDDPLYIHRSPPLPEILALMNKESDNYSSEYVLAALGLAVTGSAERRYGLQTLMRFLVRNGIEEKQVNFVDGCGLTRQNLSCARAIVKLLQVMYAHPQHDVFTSTLAISGIDGTLSYRLSTNGLARRVLGKTGTMTHVSGVAGYATTNSGEPFAFAILCNNFRTTVSHVRWQQDRLIERVISDDPK